VEGNGRPRTRRPPPCRGSYHTPILPGFDPNPLPLLQTEDDQGVWKSELSPGRRWLVEMMQRIAYGRIEDLHLRRGEPVQEPLPRLICEHRLLGPWQPPKPPRLRDYLVKRQVAILLAELTRMDTGVVTIEVQEGLPFRISWEIADRT
jgi:hypothetical protein